MLTSWRDQADLIIGRCWNSPVLTVIAWLILAKGNVIPNETSHGAYIFDAGGEVLFIKYGPILFQTWVSKSEVGRV